MKKVIIAAFATLVLSLPSISFAQEPAADSAAQGNAAVASAPKDATLQRLEQLERELQEMKATLAKREAGTESKELLGFQLQLRFHYFDNEHNRRNDVFAPNNHEREGWGIGVGLRLPLWTQIFDGVNLVGALDIGFRQLDDGPHATAPITGKETTISYINVIAAPMLQFEVTPTIRPFVFAGPNVQVESPPTDGISYVDLGVCFGAGVDFKLMDKVSVGFDLKYTIFGFGDQEDSEYIDLGFYIGFNF